MHTQFDTEINFIVKQNRGAKFQHRTKKTSSQLQFWKVFQLHFVIQILTAKTSEFENANCLRIDFRTEVIFSS